MFQLACRLPLIVGSSALGLGHHSHQRTLAGAAERQLPSDLPGLQTYTLQSFVQDFGRNYVPGTEEWAKREQIFQTNLDKILSLRSIPSLSWSPGVTTYLDYTESEYSQLLGYRGRRSRPRGSALAPLSRNRTVADFHSAALPGFSPPASFFVGAEGPLTSLVRDQGPCGSCWAASATSVLEGAVQNHPEIMKVLSVASGKNPPTLASQVMLSCTPNPDECGGTGGCAGATAELAYDVVKAKGLPLAIVWPYTASSMPCDESKYMNLKVKIRDYKVLPKNKLAPLKHAIADNGAPIVVSVDATNWFMYTSGIFSDNPKKEQGKGDFTVNHAVTLMGYTEKSDTVDMGYWLIKNSWGTRFGEKGYIRVEMKDDEENHCGWDTDTHIGLACKNDPDKDWVCGTSGILYDSSFPVDPYIEPMASVGINNAAAAFPSMPQSL